MTGSGAAPVSLGLPPDLQAELEEEPLFACLALAERASLLAQCSVVNLAPEQGMLPELDPETMHRVEPIPYIFVIEGMVSVRTSLHGVEKLLNYTERREIFSPESYSDAERVELEVVSMSPVTALLMPPSSVAPLLEGHPGFKGALTALLAVAVKRRERYFDDPHKARMASFVVEERLLPTNRVKVLREDLCVECDACYAACAERHGVSRIWPSETKLGVIQIPYNCHNCHYPTCEPSCRFDVLRYDEREPELRVKHDCVGCQQCARACSYGAITMVPFDAIDPSYLQERSPDARGGRMYSIKCDNCVGYEDLACVTACPTGALFQVDGAALLDLLENLDERGTSRRVLDKLNPEPLSPLVWLSWFGLFVVTLLASWEVVGRFFVPEYTIYGAMGWINLAMMEETDLIYRYRAGEDLSMVYGYLAAGLAAASQLYRVRKWTGRYGGDMRLWLQFHIVVSLAGVMFAFWHIALNFVNLPAIAWWAFAIVIGSGVVGTYLHTFLPKTVAGRELKLEQLRERLARLNREIEQFYSTKRGARLALSGGGKGKKGGNATKLTRLQDLKMLNSGESEFLTGVFKLVMADIASLQDRDSLQRAAARRAGVTGEKKRELEKLLVQRSKLERGVAFYEKFREYSRKWLAVHRAFSYIFFVALALHIAIELIW